MYWEEKIEKATYVIPDNIVDLAFRIACRCLPVDHAYPLSQALHKALPWLETEQDAGIHSIHVADSGNGWQRPEQGDDSLLYLSKRTKLTLRLPKHRIMDAQRMTGNTLDIDGYPLTVGTSTVRPLSSPGALFSRYVVADPAMKEEEFVELAVGALHNMGIRVKKLLCGKSHLIHTPQREVFTRSLMLADLEVEESVKLQEKGLGTDRKLGCGLFIPHKSITAIKKQDEA